MTHNDGGAAMPKILTIDDEVEFANTIKNYFTPRGYAVFSASTGEAGLEVAKREMPDVVLVDLKMPGIDGDEVLKRLKEIHPAAKPIMITAFQDDEGKTKSRIMNIGVYAYFEKPIASMKKLEETIKQALKGDAGR